ncbi:MAG: hypothetical protein AB8E82_08070 [Aureispira sp.]
MKFITFLVTLSILFSTSCRPTPIPFSIKPANQAHSSMVSSSSSYIFPDDINIQNLSKKSGNISWTLKETLTNSSWTHEVVIDGKSLTNYEGSFDLKTEAKKTIEFYAKPNGSSTTNTYTLEFAIDNHVYIRHVFHLIVR